MESVAPVFLPPRPWGSNGMFQMFVGYASVLTVAVLYYAWRDGYSIRSQRRANVNERVAYLLWVAAQRAG